MKNHEFLFTLFFITFLVIVVYIGPVLLGALLADRNAKGQNSNYKKMSSIVPWGSLGLFFIEVAWFLFKGEGCLNFEHFSLIKEIFIPLTIASASAFLTTLAHGTLNQISEREWPPLVLPSLLATLISSIPWVIYFWA
jgi:ACR3 family arsenite efflux pump ArsB